MIPPYGLPELGGWIRHKSDVSESLRHPIGRYLDGGNRTLPRALHSHHLDDSIWLMPYSGSEQFVRNIPIHGGKILVRVRSYKVFEMQGIVQLLDRP